MEGFLVLLGIAYLLILPILTLIAWSRSSSHARQLEELQRALKKTENSADILLARTTLHSKQIENLSKDGEGAARPDTSTPHVAPLVVAPVNPQTEKNEAIMSAPVKPSEPAIPAKAFTADHYRAVPPVAKAQPAPELISAEVKPDEKETRKIIVDSVILRDTEKRAPAQPANVTPTLVERAFVYAKNWLFGGNTLVRMGIVLVFLGLAFLLRYASERVVIPLEMRYLGVALSAIVALVLGWRLRLKRPDYALLMQGGAVAVMYLTVFAALKLHGQPLLPTEAGFALLVAVVALSGVLAVAQNALSLAVAGALGGFATPVLLSTGSGNHVALFTYFALLNSGIFGIAWFKAWRPLNLVGFFGTFLIGLAWGMRSYDPLLHYANTQPFLILFFLMFVGIGLLFARRTLLDDPSVPTSRDTAAWTAWLAQQGHAAQRYVDGTLLFGTPLAGFGLQYALIRHIEYGTAFSSLALGMFYLLLARVIHSSNPQRHRLLTEVLLALGVIFASLAIPLGLDAQWTSASWAVEAAGIYWIGHRQQRPLARAFALLLQAGATLAFLRGISYADETLLNGSTLGALLLALSFLSDMLVLRRRKEHTGYYENWDANLEPVFGTLGLWYLYLIAPFNLSTENTAAVWAVAGVVTVFAGLRFKARGWVANALLVQMLAGFLFLQQIRTDSAADGALALAGSGLHGLLIATLIGFASLVGIGAAIRSAHQQNDPVLIKRLSWSMLFGLGFIALGVLFVLPWQTAMAVWAACGFVLMWLAMRLKLKPPFWFALALEVIAGIAFIKSSWFHLFNLQGLPLAEAAAPFAHSGFWTPVIIALAAFAVAWRLHAYARSPAASETDGLSIDGNWFSFAALLWSTAWWVFAWWMEWARVDELGQQVIHHFLAVMATTTLVLLPIAAKWRWSRLAEMGSLLLPLIALIAAVNYKLNLDLLDNLGWLALSLALFASFGLLRIGKGLLGEHFERRLHLFNCWIWLGVTALEVRYLFLTLGEPGSAWRWLGWVIPLAAWLLWNSRKTPPKLWPAAAFPQLYRISATAPLLLILLLWLAMVNISSSGDASPLPFIPLLNPLDMALVLLLFSGWQWLLQLRVQNPVDCVWQPFTTQLQLLILTGAFLTYTCVILRGAHHLAGVAWLPDEMMNSMLVQASLSIGWALLALGMMIAGHRSTQRMVWIAGAALVGLVLAKLFLIELSNRGGIERIVSFIGVGVLLLVVGYFAPLPPKKQEKIMNKESLDASAN